MANVILPIASVCLTLGGTFNMFSYDTGERNCNKSIFSDFDFREDPVDNLYSRYYVVQGGELPYSAMGLPIDLLRKFKSYGYHPSSHTTGVPGILRNSGNPDAVVVFTVTEYRAAMRRVKKNALPISSWKKFAPKTQTHYAEAMHYGGRCIGMAEFMTEIPGDTQVVLRILTDIMGSSGPIRDYTADMWRKAIKTARESPDVRGYINLKSFQSDCQNVKLPFAAQRTLEAMLEVLPNVKDLTIPYNRENQRTTPIYVSFKPLRNLDDEYPAVEKKEKSEEYLVKLDRMIDDLKSISEQFRRFVRWEQQFILDDFEKVAESVFYDLEGLVMHGRKHGGEISIYEDLDETKFDEAFKNYKAGLYKREHNYYSSLKWLIEDIGTLCNYHVGFLKPTTGVLWTFEDEVLTVVVKNGNDEDVLNECQQHCLRNYRCRAVEFDSVENHCRIFYRSTNTAKIYNEAKWSSPKVYDRICENIR